MCLTAGQLGDYLLSDLSVVKYLLAYCGYGADRFRDGLQDKGITPCPSKEKPENAG